VALRVEVIVEPQVVLDVVNLACFAQVSGLKSGLEDQHVVQGRHCERVLRRLEVFAKAVVSETLKYVFVQFRREVSFSGFLEQELLRLIVLDFGK
jgi:hypothetical protein